MSSTSITTLISKYDQANLAQGQAQQAATQIIDKLRALMDTELNPLRRDLQHASDMAWPHRMEKNSAHRKVFGLQADRALA